ncbi:hypothetical protein [Bradyrhizobium sp. LTSPM299]|uniref:hypothetical protein n=1 Tax=Bradyrhizobium sp. LTSPM299 TaxID=1619233 RepID=UPI000B2C56A7|nr:hypothetical protein [Bradyrhizobium sp. LTSPM299]
MPDIEYIRAEIERMRVQVGRQRKEILTLERAGIPTASASLLLGDGCLRKSTACVPYVTGSRKTSRAQRPGRLWEVGAGEATYEMVLRRTWPFPIS